MVIGDIFQPGEEYAFTLLEVFEHTLILSGDVTTDEGDFGAGDYFGMAAGTMHAAWSTRGGCRVLIQYEA